MKTISIDTPELNDNRRYDYSDHPYSDRYEYPIIANLVEPNSTVIDLGCGNGSLLALLKKEKNITETGIEISESGVSVCKQRGLNVRLGEIDGSLPFPDNSFDYAICNVTIQMVTYPEVLMQEMKRIARFQILSFPNFAFWRNRFELMLKGRMPRKMLFGYRWYSTGHIHQLSIKDFYELVMSVGGLSIVERKYEHSSNLVKNYFMQAFPNVFQMVPIFLLEKKNAQ